MLIFFNSREEEATSAIDIEFHNAAKHRPIRLVDHFGFTMGAMNEFIVALAAPSHHATQDDSRDHPRCVCNELRLLWYLPLYVLVFRIFFFLLWF